MNHIIRNNRIYAVLGAGLGTLFLLFHNYGVSIWNEASGNSLFRWLYYVWSSESTEAVDYSHGLIIPLVSLWLLWHKRTALLTAFANPMPHTFGIALWAGAILLHFAGLRSQIPVFSVLSFIVSLWALVWTLAGKEAAKLTLFPVAFLTFAIPIGFLAHATFPLRLFGSVAATGFLNGIGIETIRRGTAVYSTAGQGFAMDVADACSGIRSIMALMALTAAYAYIVKPRNIERWILFMLSVPIAALANIGRIVTIAIVARFFGQDAGMKLYHDYSGYLVFILAVLLVMAADFGIEKLKSVSVTTKYSKHTKHESV